VERAETKRGTSLLVEGSLILTVIFFGTNFVATKFVVEVVPPLVFAAGRFTLAGILLWAILRLLEPESRLHRKHLLPMLGLGVVGITLTQSVFTTGVSLTTASNTALVYTTSPLWGMLLGMLLGLERPRLRGIFGLLLALTGVGFVVYEGLEIGGTSFAGDLLILAAAVCWGSYTMLSLRMLRGYSPLAVAAYPMVLGGLATFPLAFFQFPAVDPGAVSLDVWAAAAYSLLFSSAFGFVAWQRGVSRIGANRVLVYQNLVTLTGVTSGIVLLGESFGTGQLLGAAVLILGVYLARRQ
jgi:drug/metabolite transporter (DMT)-like permease